MGRLRHNPTLKLTSPADLNSNNSFDSGASLLAGFPSEGFNMDQYSAFTAINDYSVGAGSARTVSPKDVFNDSFGSAPPSTAFTNLTSPDIDQSPFYIDSVECSPMFQAEPLIDSTNAWFPLFPEDEVKIPDVTYVPALPLPLERTISSQSMQRSASSSSGSPVVLDSNSFRRKSGITNSPTTNGISKARRARTNNKPLDNIPVDPNDKTAMKRRRNTIAARDSRQRKLNYVIELETRISELEMRDSELETQNSEMKNEVEKWKNLAIAHGYNGP